jgi:hypothetical protein
MVRANITSKMVIPLTGLGRIISARDLDNSCIKIQGKNTRGIGTMTRCMVRERFILLSEISMMAGYILTLIIKSWVHGLK